MSLRAVKGLSCTKDAVQIKLRRALLLCFRLPYVIRAIEQIAGIIITPHCAIACISSSESGSLEVRMLQT